MIIYIFIILSYFHYFIISTPTINSITATTTILTSDTSINQITNIQLFLEITPSGTFDTSTYIVITFPNQFSISSLSAVDTCDTDNNDLCNTCINNFDICPPTSANPIGSTQVNRVFNLTNIFQINTTTIFFYYSFDNIKLPSIAGQTDNFLIQFWDSNSQTSPFYSLNQSSTSLLIANANCSCQIFPQNTIVSAHTKINISVTPSTTIITPNFTLSIIFPKSWSNQNSVPILTKTATVCTNIFNLNNSINCSLISSNTVQVSNISNRNITSLFTFSLDSVINPPKLGEQDNTTIKIVNELGKDNEICTCSFQNLTPGIITKINFTMDASISTFATGYLTLSPQSYTFLDTIIITFPSQLSIQSCTVNSISSSAPATGFTYQKAGNILTIKPTSVLQFYNITIANILSPTSQLPTSQFIITTTKSTYITNNISYCCYSATSPGQLNATIIPFNNTISTKTDYTISLVLTHLITITGWIQIIFPVNYTNSNLNQSNCSFPGCSFVNNSNMFNISLQNSGFSPSFNINIVIYNVTNPSIAGITTPFIIKTVYSNLGGYVDINSNTTITFTGSNISNVIITPTSYSVYANISLKISINNSQSLSSGTIIQIVIPNDFTVLNLNATVGNIPVIVSKIDTYTYNLINAINSPIAPGGMNISTNEIILNNLINPISLNSTNNFTIILYTSNFIQIQKWIGSSVTPTTLTNLTYLNINPSVLYVGGSCDYTFIITTPYVMSNSTTFIISFSTSYSIPNIITCSALLNIQTLTCTNSGANVINLVLNLINNVYTIQFILKNITNPLTSKSIALITVIGVNNNFNSTNNTYDFTSFYIPNILTYTLSYSNVFLGQPTSLKFSIILTNPIPLTGYIIINIPQEYTVISLSCTAPSNMTTMACISLSTYVLKLYSTVPTIGFINSFTFNLTGISNPTNFYSSYFSISSYDFSGAQIDRSYSNIKYISNCNNNCRTCSSTNLSFCLTCYTNTSFQSVISNMQYLLNNQCVSSCGLGYFILSSVCKVCNSACYTCDGTLSNNCLSCNPQSLNKYYDSIQKTCNTTCISGYYNDDSLNKCLLCTNNCTTCSSIFNCSTCSNPYYFYNYQCILACPNSMYNDSNRICLTCSSNCLQCTNSSVCITCDISYVTYLGLCYTDCSSAGLNIYFDNHTSTCVSSCSSLSNCLTCSLISTNCTSCNLSSVYKYMYLQTCLTKCPDGYYYNLSQISCKACTGSCNLCFNSSYCYSCISSSLIAYNGNCISSCPISTINIGGICQNCNSNCSTCIYNTSYCLTCVSGAVFFSSLCLSTCPTGFFNYTNICYRCNPNCSTCVSNNPQNCTYCKSGYFLFTNKCNNNCPSTYFPDSLINNCSSCPNNCLTCTTNSSCIQCKDSYYLKNNMTCINLTDCQLLNFYPYNDSVILQCLTTCMIQCEKCINSADSCIQCNKNLSNQYLFNPITMHCLFTCEKNYYVNGSYCIPCQSPCKTCDSLYNVCSSCITGFLYLGQCIQNCLPGYFKNQNNFCITCPNQCLNCSNLTFCYNCSSNTVKFNNTCYFQCPNIAPYSINKYCTNCPKISYCVFCNNNSCTDCIYGYYIYKGLCVKACPVNYEIDNSGTNCKQNNNYINQLYNKDLQNKKNLPFPFIIVLIIFFLIVYYSKIKQYDTNYICSLNAFIGLIQFFSWILLLTLYFIYQTVQMYIIYLAIIFFTLNFLINILNIIPIILIFKKDASYLTWQKQYENSNKTISHIIIIISLLTSFKITRAIFSRLFDKHYFQARLLGIDKFYYWNKLSIISIFFVQIPAIVFGLSTGYNELGYKTKVFFQSIEVVFLGAFAIYLQIADLKKDQFTFFKIKQETAQQALDRLKQYLQWGNFYSDEKKITRTKSEGNYEKERSDYRKILQDDYISVYNPDDYQDVPKMQNRKIQKGIQKGRFRRRKKKKDYDDFDGISQQSWESQSEDTKNKRKYKSNKIKSYINNYIYWKPPEKNKKRDKNTKKMLPYDQEKIMQTIRNKQSQFDIMSRNQDLYVQNYRLRKNSRVFTKLDESQRKDPTKISLDVSYSQQPILPEVSTNNFVFNFDPNDMINLNYAKKKHLKKGKQQDTQSQLIVERRKRKKKRVDGVLLKNTRY